MGFSGGGSNILKPHTHDSTIVQDGGSLNMQNITQGNMSAGSITQSDGIHLQELAIGTALQVPRVNSGATALEYADGTWTEIANVNLSGGAASSLSATVSPVKEFWDVNIYGGFTAADRLSFRVGTGGVSLVNYASNISTDGGASSFGTSATYADPMFGTTGSNMYCHLRFHNRTGDMGSWVGSMTSNGVMYNFSGTHNIPAAADTFQIYGSNAGNNLAANVVMIIYGA